MEQPYLSIENYTYNIYENIFINFENQTKYKNQSIQKYQFIKL